MIIVTIPGAEHMMPGVTLFPEALSSILETVQKALGTVFFALGNPCCSWHHMHRSWKQPLVLYDRVKCLRV